ncbi:hypothetical protein BKA70DRAFT_1483308, partial [Coprinopsis sp. MPI-PUGE-AT-0042]
MGASFSKWARWNDTAVQQVPTSEAPPAQYFGPALFQGAQNLTINGGVFSLSYQQVACRQDQQHLRQVLDFLSLVNFRTIQQENLSKWTPDTLKWLLGGSIFQWWLNTQGSILWGTGMPGAGKTTLASVVIQHSEDCAQASSDICVGFVYCRYTEPMKVRDILAALARQLLERYPHLLLVVEPLYAKHDLQITKPTQSELIDVICKICSSFRIARLFIDGLDEAIYDEQFDLLDTLKSVPANFFITSRPLIRLKDVLPGVTMFDIAAQNADIELLVSQHIQRYPDLREVLAEEEQRGRVIKKICQSSHGMFLHASLMVEAVSHCISAAHIMEQLDKLPAKLDLLYEASFLRIEMQPEERAALATRVLLWVTYAYRPLTVQELRYAVASDPPFDGKTPDNLVPESLLVSVCCGLVVPHAHLIIDYTALDALKRRLEMREVSPHCMLAEVCIERLMNCGIPRNEPPYQSQRAHPRSLQPILQGQPPQLLLEYAYESWHFHAKLSIQCPPKSDSRPVASILRFLSMCKYYPLRRDSKSIYPGHPSTWDNFTTPIHLAVCYQLSSLLPLVDSQVNERTKRGRSALSLAAWQNDDAMVELLLKLDKIDVNLQDDDGNTAIMLAAGRGCAAAVKVLLLDPRIDIHKRNEEGETAVHCALARGTRGHTEAALHLIATPGVDINAANNYGHTPLMVAYEHPLRLLDSLAHHPEIDFFKRDHDGFTPLMHACRRGPSSAVQWYLRLPGADARDNWGASALIHRATNSRGAVDCLSDFRALVDAGIDINEEDDEGFTALAYTIHSGLKNATRALLQLAAVEDKKGRSLLMAACDAVLNGTMTSSNFSGLLRHTPFDINAKNSHGMTALAYAVARGVLATAEDILSLSPKGLN